MKIEKLPSGSYRVRLTEAGKTYSVTVPYKPTEKQAYELLRAKIDKPVNKYDHMTFREAGEKYIEIKESSLSVTTIKGYKSVYKNSIPEYFMAKELQAIDRIEAQELINKLSKNYSAKTIKNIYGFVSAVIKEFIPNVDLSVTTPKVARTEPYIPSSEDVKKLMNSCKDTEYWVPLYLACLSLRRSEICGLSIEDLTDDNVLKVHHSLLIDKDNNYVRSDILKTDASYREIIIPQELADRIREQGYVYKYNPNAIDNFLRRRLPALGIPVFSAHKLRHFFASYAHELGYSDAVVQSIGGWQTDHVMKTVYRHAMNKDEARANLSNDISSILS